jgi:hypothetical protein
LRTGAKDFSVNLHGKASLLANAIDAFKNCNDVGIAGTGGKAMKGVLTLAILAILTSIGPANAGICYIGGCCNDVPGGQVICYLDSGGSCDDCYCESSHTCGGSGDVMTTPRAKTNERPPQPKSGE